MTVADVLDLARTVGPMVALEGWQDGRCALCGGEVPLRWAVADHCHTTCWVRGLLRMSCNALEAHGGRARDPHHGQALLRYLDHSAAALLGLRVKYSDARRWKSSALLATMRRLSGAATSWRHSTCEGRQRLGPLALR